MLLGRMVSIGISSLSLVSCIILTLLFNHIKCFSPPPESWLHKSTNSVHVIFHDCIPGTQKNAELNKCLCTGGVNSCSYQALHDILTFLKTKTWRVTWVLSTYLFIVPKFKWAILSGFYQRNLVNRPCLICENNTFLFLRNCSPQVQPCTSYGGIEIAALSLHTHIHHTHNTPLKCMRWWTHGPSTRNLWLQ